jgi:hypothetical protein
VNVGELSSRSPDLRVGDVIWYLSASVGAVESRLYAEASDGIVVRGDSGVQTAFRLRQMGWQGRLWLDPAVYERPSVESDQTLFGDRWAVIQIELEVADRISPGSFVPAADRAALRQAISRERRWLDDSGGGRLSLALHSAWLTSDTQFVVDELLRQDGAVALALADPNDPLGGAGAVEGLVTFTRELPDLVLLRCDIGALGAVANGARQGAIGTSTMVRHAVPPGKSGGGVPGDRTPSVFVPALLSFKLGSFLDQLPREAAPTCDLACCLGSRLSRFNDVRTTAEARVHNRLAIQTAIDAVLQRPPAERPAAFRSLCQQAVYEADALSALARRQIPPSRQLLAWSTLS